MACGLGRIRGTQTCFPLLFVITYMSVTLSCFYLALLQTNQQAWGTDDSFSATENTTLASENTQTTPETTEEEEMRRIDFEMEKRRARIHGLCNSSTANTSLVMVLQLNIIRKLYIDRKHKLTWCPTYKAGSSAWMEIFVSLGGELTLQAQQRMKAGKLQINQLARTAFPIIKDPDLAAKHISSTTRLLIVRHPFERLLAAYRDKLQHRARREYYYNHFGRIMVRDYNGSRDQVEPTFEQFLHYIADRRMFDEHWRPYNMECAPCAMDYHFILKTEFLEREQKYLANKFHLKEFMPQKINITHHNTNPSGRTGLETANQYFSSVPQKLLKRVYQIYANDFKLFGYSPKEYLDMAEKL